MTRLASITVLALLTFWRSTARADAALDAGLAALDEGDFEAAAAAFDAALAGDELSRQELLALLEARAALHFALHEESALDHDLRWLAALDPGHDFGDNRPPDLARRFVEIQQDHPGALEISVTALPFDAGVRVTARTRHVPEGMPIRLQLCGRTERAPWRCVDGDEARFPVSASGISYYAEVLGPGGAVVASAGSATDPLHLAPPGSSEARPAADGARAAAESTAEPASGSDEPRSRRGLALGLGIGGGVLAATLAVVLALTLGNDAGIHVRTPTLQ